MLANAANDSASVDALQPHDFLRRDARTHLSEDYCVAGAGCTLSTNSEEIIAAARTSFRRVTKLATLDFSLRFWVEESAQSQSPWPNPYVRGLDHLVFAGFDCTSSILADLQTRQVIGRFSAAMAADAAHWRNVIFPIVVSILGGSLGFVELHASCIAKDGRGLLLIGPSRSGKSTLAMALNAAGFTALSDDRAFCSRVDGRLQAWCPSRPVKLRPDAARWFDEYRGREPTAVQNGVRVFHCEPRGSRSQSIRECVPAMMVFLERQDTPCFSLKPILRGEAALRIERELLAESPEALQKQSRTLDQVLSLPCRILRYGGTPQAVAEKLAGLFLYGFECLSPDGAA
ncbi:MAG TPA: hypothetical protein VMH04_09470 [Candidatus Solibacter sp.]|nr:hypothetical protein [Candidatus Solibacter sp.]